MDPKREYRWVDPKRVEERKDGGGYQFTKSNKEGFVKEDGTLRTKGRMVLMDRDRQIADESAKQKEFITRSKTKAVRESFHDDIEALSSKHGVDLHRLVEKIEDHED